jgi:hypothetical protein
MAENTNNANPKMNYRLSRMLLVSLSLVAVQAAAERPVEVHQYTITVDYALQNLWVEARFASPVHSISARSRDAGKFLVDVRGCDSEQNIHLRNRRMMLPVKGIACINYTVDLSKAARHDRNYRGLKPDNIIVSPSIWLWRPEITRRSEIQAQFHLPQDVQISVPWPAIDGVANTYRLARSPESGNALVVLGKFDYDELHIPGSTLRVALLDTGAPIDRPAILNWLGDTATNISLAYGRFPNPSPQVVIVPVANSRSDSAVPFGRVIRDGGETVQLFVNADKPVADYGDDWTATHEFSHMMLPYLRQKHRWIAEGFAQYYQNVLLTRSGTYDEQLGWQKIVDGLRRGRKSRPELSPNEAAEGGIRTGLMKVYWSGAAIALMADVQLRERSGGTETLDSVLGRLQECCLPADRVWSGIELFRKLDSLTEQDVFIPLYRRYANTAGFPDTSELLTKLGIAVAKGKVRIRRNSELGEIRAAITETDTSGHTWRNRLAAR